MRYSVVQAVKAGQVGVAGLTQLAIGGDDGALAAAGDVAEIAAHQRSDAFLARQMRIVLI